jgi:hypothetical protein
MRNQKLKNGPLHREENDMRDWYLIGFIALASLLLWLPLLVRA